MTSIPLKLSERLKNLGISLDIYDRRTRKCILSKENPILEKVPWYSNAYFMPDGFKTDSLIFDPVSLVPCIALEPSLGDKILDMCAAPGAKTYIMSFMTNGKANITANDIDKNRLRRLEANALKYDIRCNITNVSGRTISGDFNKILLDAPCSGEGMVNKKEKLFKHWSERRVKFYAKKQKKLIKRAFDILTERGTLVYSTCTFAPEENEAVIDFLLTKNENAQVADMSVPIAHFGGVTEWNGVQFDENVRRCMRIYPNQNGTGGFFVAKIRKS